ncbi:MAG: O-antigen ligase family protein, partial [Bradymonadaceae bacterium]
MKRAVDALFGTLLVATPLAVGGVHGVVAYVVAAAGLVLVGLGIHRAGDEKLPISIPALAFWLFATVCLVQLVPVPGVVQSWVNPQGWELYSEGWALLFGASEAVPARMISLDPSDTAADAARWLAYGSIAVFVGIRSRDRTFRDWVPWVVGASAGVGLLAGSAQELGNADKVLFVYEPAAHLRPLTTFINPNHAALFYGIAGLAAFGAAARAQSRNQVAKAIFAALASTVLLLLMFEFNSLGSNGAILGGVLALAVGVFAVIRERSHDKGQRRRRLLAAGALAIPVGLLIIGFASIFGPTPIRDLFWDSSAGMWVEARIDARIHLVEGGWKAARDFPWLGAGAGALDRMLAPYLDWSAVKVAAVPETVENEPVDWLVSFGFPVAIVGLMLLAGYLAGALRDLVRQPGYGVSIAFGVAVAVLVGVQFHFPFRALGLGLPIVCLMESGLASASKSRMGWTRTRIPTRSVVVGTTGVAIGVALAGALAMDWEADARGVTESGEFTEAQLRSATRAIPSDGRLYASAALAAVDRNDTTAAVARAKHAREVRPTAEMTRFLGSMYRHAGDEKSAVREYRRLFGGAFEGVPGDWIGEHLLANFRDPETLAEILADAEADYWSRAYRRIEERFDEMTAIQFGIALTEHRPKAYKPYRLVYGSYLSQNRYQL